MVNKRKERTISDEAVKNATGKDWSQWFKVLDKEGAVNLSHKEIAKLLQEKKYIESGWWAQSITVEYEYARGKRVVGETASSGFEVGVQKTILLPVEQVWDILTQGSGLRLWLGDIDTIKLEKGYEYVTKDGAQGEIRSIEKNKKLRLTWHPSFLRQSSTVQVYVSCPRNTKAKTTVLFHQEKLSSAKERAKMKEYWMNVLNQLEQLAKQ